MDVMGYEMKPVHATRCQGINCGLLIGPTEQIRSGFVVKDGEVTGVFHSRACYTNSVEKFNEHKSEGGEQ